jgi:hypothetical protein
LILLQKTSSALLKSASFWRPFRARRWQAEENVKIVTVTLGQSSSARLIEALPGLSHNGIPPATVRLKHSVMRRCRWTFSELSTYQQRIIVSSWLKLRTQFRRPIQLFVMSRCYSILTSEKFPLAPFFIEKNLSSSLIKHHYMKKGTCSFFFFPFSNSKPNSFFPWNANTKIPLKVPILLLDLSDHSSDPNTIVDTLECVL